jgi:predicted metalloprotease with PDZ domain
VIVGSPAQRAGLRPGDTIVTVNGRDPRLRGSFADRQVGARWVVRIQRAGEERDVSFVIAAPAESPG